MEITRYLLKYEKLHFHSTSHLITLQPDLLWSLGKEPLVHATTFGILAMVLFYATSKATQNSWDWKTISTSNNSIFSLFSAQKMETLTSASKWALNYITRKLIICGIRKLQKQSIAYQFLVWG